MERLDAVAHLEDQKEGMDKAWQRVDGVHQSMKNVGKQMQGIRDFAEVAEREANWNLERLNDNAAENQESKFASLTTTMSRMSAAKVKQKRDAHTRSTSRMTQSQQQVQQQTQVESMKQEQETFMHQKESPLEWAWKKQNSL